MNQLKGRVRGLFGIVLRVSAEKLFGGVGVKQVRRASGGRGVLKSCLKGQQSYPINRNWAYQT